MAKLRIDIWSDIACPWCYVGKRRLEQALARFSHRDDVEVVWRAFELDPSAPRVRDTRQSYAERLARKYGTTPAQAQAMIDRMVDTAAGDGLALRFDHIRPGNTFDAHRLLHLAHERGVQDALKERLLRAYLTEGQVIGEPDVLAPLAREVGLDEREVADLLAGDRCAAEVRQDEALARELGITGVPFFVLAGRL
ncbi:MAG TPA: DsbA family oxidoreductase, partial [Kofleriaceae bacterium]